MGTGLAATRHSGTTTNYSSCPGLTRASINENRNALILMDCRVKPGNDEIRPGLMYAA
jgi:hypothetical protein